MALFMVTFMSLYGLVYNGQSVTLSSLWPCLVDNAIMALPLIFLVVGPHLHAWSWETAKLLPGEVDENFEDDDEYQLYL